MVVRLRLIVGSGVVLLGSLSGLLSVSLVGEAPPPYDQSIYKVKLERKNFVERIQSYRVIGGQKQQLQAEFEMVYVPGGEVTIGSPPDEPGRQDNEGPQYRAKVGSFWMQKCEVTWEQWDVFWYDEDFLKADDERAAQLPVGEVTRPTNTFVDETYGHGREGHPVLCMTHHAAMVYCEWLRRKTGKPYRLPTETEWEYAARAGKGDLPWFFGRDPEQLKEYAWYAENSYDEDYPDKPKGCTHKVGTRKPNPFGLHDLYGNVWEWTLDQYDPQAYARRARLPLNLRPVTPPTDKKWSHVVRGGSWADKADRCRSAARRISEESWQKHDPQEPRSIWWLTKMDVIGFRVVLPEEEQPELWDLKPRVVKRSE
jgi:formylglycine-generating enzyme required for sulfatase activity